MTEPSGPPPRDEPPAAPPPPPPPEEPPSAVAGREEGRGPSTGALALGVLLAAAGVVWLLASVDVLDLSAEVWLGVLLVLVGLALVVLPAGARGVLVVVGIVLALAGAAASAIDVELEGGIGESRERPRNVGDLEDEYSLAMGSLKLDLTALEVDAGDTVEVDASVGIGELVVAVPPDVTVVVDANLGIGDVQALDEQESGTDVDVRTRREGAGGELVLRLDGGIGSIKVGDDAPF